MSGSKLLATIHLDDGAEVQAHASTLKDGGVMAGVAVRAPGTFDHIVTIYSTDLDALDQLADALHRAAKLGRAEAAKTPALAAAPDSSPEAAGVPPTAAPGEPSAVSS